MHFYYGKDLSPLIEELGEDVLPEKFGGKNIINYDEAINKLYEFYKNYREQEF